jgi:hypothetical protein
MENQYTADELTEFAYLMELYARFDHQIELLRIAARDFSQGSDVRYAAILNESHKLRSMIVQLENLEPFNSNPASM